MAKATRRTSEEKAAEEVTVTPSSGNVFEDLGFENPEEELARAKLVNAISELIAIRKLSQTAAAKVLEIDQPTISRLMNGRTSGFTMDRLIRYLNLLDADVEVFVRPKVTSRAQVRVARAL